MLIVKLRSRSRSQVRSRSGPRSGPKGPHEKIKVSGVSSKEVTEMVLLQAYFRNSDVLNGFYGLPRSGANYI